MVDNPKKFVTYVIIAIIVLVVIVALFRLFGGDVTQNTKDGAATTTETKTQTTGTKSTATQKTNTQSSTPTPQAIAYDAIVTYTNSGFTPNTIEVKAGASVRFINKSAGTMWVSAVSNAQGSTYPEFSQSKSLGTNGVFDFNFSKKGVWLYENMNDKSKTGIVIVK